MILCIHCNEFNPNAKIINTYASKTTTFRLFETLTRELREVSYEELFAGLHSGKIKVANLEVKDDKIKGKGIDIARLYNQPTDSRGLALIYCKVNSPDGKLYGYDIVDQDGNVTTASHEHILNYFQSGIRVANATIATGNLKLISLLGVIERTLSTKSDKVEMSDIDDDISIDRALKLLGASGFRLGYNKKYRGEVAGQMTDCNLCIYYKDSSIIWFNIDSKSPDRYLNSPGGRMFAQGKGEGTTIKLCTSKYEVGQSNDSISIDTFKSGGVLRAARAFSSANKPVEYFLDSMGEITEDFSITSLDIRYTEAVLRDKYFEMQDDIGEGYITYLFIQNEYARFDTGLKNLYKHLRKYSREMLTDKIIRDIKALGGGPLATRKIKYYLAELLKSFPNTDYSFSTDVAPYIAPYSNSSSTTDSASNKSKKKGIKGFMQMFKR